MFVRQAGYAALVFVSAGLLHAFQQPQEPTFRALSPEAFNFQRNIGLLRHYARDPANDNVLKTSRDYSAPCFSDWPLQPTGYLKESREWISLFGVRQTYFCSRTYDYLREIGQEKTPIPLELNACEPFAAKFVQQCDAVEKQGFPVDTVGMLKYLNGQTATADRAIGERILKLETEHTKSKDFLLAEIAKLRKELEARQPGNPSKAETK